jgi:pimeloyl-ACP methyl ester carboxylesterase
MSVQFSDKQPEKHLASDNLRSRLLAKIPVIEKRIQLAGIPTAVLEGGEDLPIILLHGPGESAVWWMRVIPNLVKTYRVIVPDLPGHGTSGLPEGTLNPSRMCEWLEDLIGKTCPTPPVVVGHLSGGAIAARFAIQKGNLIRQLILVDSFGLEKFRPSPKFAFGLIRFLSRPSEKNYMKFMPYCMFDANSLYQQMGSDWEPFMQYNLQQANDPNNKSAMKTFIRQFAIPKIPAEDLAGIKVPTALIWGRHDQALKLQIGEAASERYGWPLHIIEEARDDAKLEQPDAFIKALYQILESDIGLKTA